MLGTGGRDSPLLSLSLFPSPSRGWQEPGTAGLFQLGSSCGALMVPALPLPGTTGTFVSFQVGFNARQE